MGMQAIYSAQNTIAEFVTKVDPQTVTEQPVLGRAQCFLISECTLSPISNPFVIVCFCTLSHFKSHFQFLLLQ